MPRPPKDAQALNIKMSSAVWRLVEKYRKQHELTRTKAIELLLAYALRKNPNPLSADTWVNGDSE